VLLLNNPATSTPQFQAPITNRGADRLSLGLYTGALALPPAARGDGSLDIKAIVREPLPLALAVREFASVC